MVIHYCWFGGKELPDEAKKCIESWKKNCPNYEIKRWDESNYDVHKNIYISQAYESKKYAFVSDYARLEIIYNEGGVYFDVDVEVIKNIDILIKKGAFLGCETDGRRFSFIGHKKDKIAVAPGLIIYADKNNPIIKSILDSYDKESFILKDGSLNTKTIVTRTTEVLKEKGLKDKKGIQYLENMIIYPKEYFCPLDYYTGELKIKKNTYSIHHYSASWQSEYERELHIRTRKWSKVFGTSVAYNVCMTYDDIKNKGIKEALKVLIAKIRRRICK